MIRTAIPISQPPSQKEKHTSNSPVPSGLPTPHNISTGWNTSDVHLGMNGDGPLHRGNAPRPVGISTSDSGVRRVAESDCTVVRWSCQCVGVIADDLKNNQLLAYLVGGARRTRRIRLCEDVRRMPIDHPDGRSTTAQLGRTRGGPTVSLLRPSFGQITDQHNQSHTQSTTTYPALNNCPCTVGCHLTF